MLPARAMLGMHAPDETLTIEDKSTIELDWVAHDIRKFARLMTNHNGYVLEQLYSPLVVVTTPAHEELIRIGKGCITRPTVRHYQGFARGRRHRLAEPDPTVKHLLYAYRLLLSGIHLMQTGEVVANVQVLNERLRLTEIGDLVARKLSASPDYLGLPGQPPMSVVSPPPLQTRRPARALPDRSRRTRRSSAQVARSSAATGARAHGRVEGWGARRRVNGVKQVRSNLDYHQRR
jgi:hypothetical protein